MADESNKQTNNNDEPVKKAETEQAADKTEGKPESQAENLKSGNGNRNFIIAIVSAVVVALILIGLGFAAYNDELSDEDETTTEQLPVNEGSEPATEEPVEEFDTGAPVTDEDLQQELDAVEQELNELDDTSEFDDSQLSDEQLNL